MKKQSHLAWLFFLIPGMVWADFAKTPQEDAMCQAMIYNGRDTSDRGNWMHMHHFCDCIRFTNRAFAAMNRPSDMKYNLQVGIGGCNYVLGHTTPNFYMRPEVHLQKGKAVLLGKQDAQAASEFLEAIHGNPNLAQAYVELSNLMARIGKKSEALKWVIDGLRHVPENKSLQRRYTDLGGKLPYPEPVKTEQPASASPVAPPQASATSTGEASDQKSPVVEQKGSELPPAVGTPPTAQPTPPASPDTSSKAPIGSPSNPWCRFCP
jgi:hypothetical protein